MRRHRRAAPNIGPLRAFAVGRLEAFRAGLQERLHRLLSDCTPSLRLYAEQPSTYLHDATA